MARKTSLSCLMKSMKHLGLSVLIKRGRKRDMLCVEGTEGPSQSFSLIIPIKHSYLLLNVAEVRLCKVDLKFGDEVIKGILDPLREN